jgi:hypothetical protein
MHNAKRMITVIADVKLPGQRNSRSLMPQGHEGRPFWIWAFLEEFHRAAKKFPKKSLKAYEAAVKEAGTANQTPDVFLHGLRDSNQPLLDIHETICKAFATSDQLYLATDAIPMMVDFQTKRGRRLYSEPYESGKRLMWVSGQQQGQVQEGDEIVLVQGMSHHVVVRRSEKALVARMHVPISDFFESGPYQHEFFGMERSREHPTSPDVVLE